MYKHTQRGTVIITVVGLAMVLMLVMFVQLRAAGPTGPIVTVVAFCLLIVVAFLFGSLTASVERDELVVAFGPGWIRMKFLVPEIVEVTSVVNQWWYGFGVRYTPHGWLYNVSGLRAVQIRLRNGRQYRIGTDEPEELAAAISRAIGQDRPAVREDPS